MAKKRSAKVAGVYVELGLDKSGLKRDIESVKAEFHAAANAWSKDLNDGFSAQDLNNKLQKLAGSVASASRAAGASLRPMNAELEKIGIVAGVSAQEMQRLSEKMHAGLVERAFANLQRQTNASHTEMARMRYMFGDTAGAAKELALAARGVALPVAAVAAGIGLAAKASFQAAMEMERLQKAYETISGSSGAASAQLQFLYETTTNLGLQFQTTAAAAKTFFAAGQGTALEKDLNKIFTAFSRAGASLSLSQEEMQGIFLALGQMMSKGKVQAEELRGQLGERLPGAFSIAAKAMGVTTAELDKMLERGQVLAEDLLPKMADIMESRFVGGMSSSQRAVNALTTEWERFKASCSATGPIVEMLQRVASALNTIAQYANLRSVSDTFAEGTELSRQGLLDMKEFTASGFLDRQKMVDAILSQRRSAASGPALLAQAEARLLSKLDAERDRVAGDARASASNFLADTLEERRRKIEDEANAAIKAQEKARAADIENAQKYDAAIAKIESHRSERLKKLDKESDAAGKQAANAAYRTADALREVQQESMRLAGDEVGLARLDMEDKFAKWQKAIGGVTPEMVKLRAEMEKALNLGLAPNAYFNATKGLKDTIAGLQAELDALDVEGGKRINPAGYARGQVMSKFEKFKLGDEWKVASEEQRKQLASQYGQLGDRAALQASDEINRDFLEKAASTFKGRTELERAALEEQMRMYAGHVQNKALLDEWYQRRFLETSKEGADGARLALLDYYDETQNAAKQWGSAVTNVAKGFEDAMVAACTKGKFEFSALADSIIADLARIAIQKSITGPLSKGLDGLLGSMFSSGSGGGTGGSASGAWGDYADRVPGIAGTRASGGPVDAGKTYLVGERGPELFQPGATGVIHPNQTLHALAGARASATGAGSSSGVTVTVINNTGQPVQTRESQDARGGRSIEVMVGEAVAKQVRRHGTEANTAMRQTFGARQALIGR